MALKSFYFFMKFLSRIWPFLIIILASLLATRLLYQQGYFPMHDDLQLGRLFQLDKCFHDGQIPCRWVPDMGYGYGYPLFNYYPPFPYYLAEYFHFFGWSLIDSIKIVFILGVFFSGIFMYFLAKEFWGRIGGIVSAVFYIWAPYHAVDVYVRGALAEFWGLVLFPAVFWAVYKLIKEENVIFILVLAVFSGLLLLSHNLMSFFFAPAVVLWAIFLVFYLRKPLRVLIKVALGGLWGGGLAAFFVLPVIFEKQFVHVETMFIGYFNYLAHFANLNQLFLSRFWGYGASTWGPDDEMAFPIGHLHWLMVFLAGIGFSLLWIKKKDKRFLLFTFYFLLFIFTAFLTHLRSTPIWQKISVLSYMQFPWRFLGLATFFASFLAGAILSFFKERRNVKIIAFILIASVITLNFSFFRPESILRISDEEKLFSAKGWLKLQTDAIFDYLPIYADRPPAGPAPEKPWLEEGQGEITDFLKRTRWIEFTARVESENAKIRVPIFYFPDWTFWIKNKKIDVSYNNELGLSTFEIPHGSYSITAYLNNTPVRTIANFISLISWIGLLGVVLKCSYERYKSRGNDACSRD